MRPERGFTLIEILVAISVLAISLVVILQLFSGGLKSVRLSNQYTRAIFYAREKMEELLLTEGLEPGTLDGGSEDSLRWTAQVVLVEPDEEDGPELPFDTLKITLQVMWEEGEKEKRFQISTLKVVEKREDEELQS
ncbi:MAG: type II secretion system protein [Deltaproteobacteria bacterium]|nr:type II secretion system protein [Deltaproteobacteria bacterium]MBW2050034.1 type II secretion system protein [Deltaproteobacteria bacterium]MBW2112794.1 type II secretion system protein [Deltaproteobacteria bacterium]MBW2354486.1 type II secretion system protein [Deltaproteobacteria bacterium]HDZ91572.1 type II secretion system protein [Deltaproteobacteria bacterium]